MLFRSREVRINQDPYYRAAGQIETGRKVANSEFKQGSDKNTLIVTPDNKGGEQIAFVDGQSLPVSGLKGLKRRQNTIKKTLEVPQTPSLGLSDSAIEALTGGL